MLLHEVDQVAFRQVIGRSSEFFLQPTTPDGDGKSKTNRRHFSIPQTLSDENLRKTRFPYLH